MSLVSWDAVETVLMIPMQNDEVFLCSKPRRQTVVHKVALALSQDCYELCTDVAYTASCCFFDALGNDRHAPQKLLHSQIAAALRQG